LTDDILSLMTGGKQSFAPAQTSQATAAPDYSGLVSSAEQRYGLPQGLLSRLIFKGERSGATAVSPKGAVGLGQLMPGTARDMGVTDPTDPAQNIDGSARYLAQMLQHYNGDQKLAVAAYNAGPATVDQYGGVPPYKETQGEVARVIGAQPDAGQSTGGADILSLATGGKQSFATAPAPNAQPKQMDANAPQSAAEFVNNANLAYRAAGNNGDAPAEAQVFQPNPDQAKTLRQMDAAGAIDRSPGAIGTAKQPYVMQSADNDTSALGPGVYYVDWKGKLQQAPGKPVGAAEGLGAGAVQGIRDVGTSGVQGKIALQNALVGNAGINLGPNAQLLGMSMMLPDLVEKRLGLQSSQDAVNNALVARDVYDARYGHSGYANVGRIGGNIAASAPIMAAGGEVLDAAAAGSPVANFIAGQAGRGLGGGVPNLLLRGASLATRGAIEGGSAAALTSSASDKPIMQQIGEGAGIGAVMHVGAPAVGKVAESVGNVTSGLLAPLTEAGRNKLVLDHLASLAKGGNTDIVPNSEIPGVTRTLAQSIPGGNPGIAASERAMRSGNTEFGNTLDAINAANNEARKNYLGSFVAPADTIEAAKTAAQANADRRLNDVFSSGGQTNAPAVVQALDDTLASPAGASPQVRTAIQTARRALVTQESGLTAPQQSAFERSVMQSMGSDAAAPSQEAMQANKDRLGAIFDQIGGKTNIQAGDEFKRQLGQVVHDAGQVLPDTEVTPLRNQVQNIVDTIGQDGTISGQSYQALIRKGSPLDRAMSSSNPNIRYYAGQLRDALDSALQASADPADVQALQTARTQYRNMKIAEGAINKAAPGQSVDPGAMLAAVKKATPNYAYTGGGDLGDAASTAVQQAQERNVYDTRPQTLHEVYNTLQGAIDRGADHPALTQAQTAILNEMEKAVPGYTAHLAQSAADQRSIAQQQYLRGLNLTTNDGTPTLNKLNGALSKIAGDPNAPVTPDTVNKLMVLRDDLDMANGSNAGMGRSSDTHQKFATNALNNALGASKVAAIPMSIAGAMLGASHGAEGAGVMGALGAAAGKYAEHVYAGKNALIQQRLRNALLDPEGVRLNTAVPAGRLGQDNKILSLLKGQAVPAVVDTKNRLWGTP
jgi:hypothetical protein